VQLALMFQRQMPVGQDVLRGGLQQRGGLRKRSTEILQEISLGT
jgi:hypothetical protein